MKHAITYARFSPRPNGAECESIEVQQEAIRKYCSENGYTIEAEYADRNASGADRKRPGLWAAMDALKRGWTLMAYQLDRLSRDEYITYMIRQECEKRKVSIISVRDEGTWTDSPSSRLVRKILQALAECEREVTGERTSLAMRRHQRNGRRMSGLLPYGFRADPADKGKLLKDETEQAGLKLMQTMREGGASWNNICKELTARGYKPRGAKWYTGSVLKIVRRANRK